MMDLTLARSGDRSHQLTAPGRLRRDTSPARYAVGQLLRRPWRSQKSAPRDGTNQGGGHLPLHDDPQGRRGPRRRALLSPSRARWRDPNTPCPAGDCAWSRLAGQSRGRTEMTTTDLPAKRPALVPRRDEDDPSACDGRSRRTSVLGPHPLWAPRAQRAKRPLSLARRGSLNLPYRERTCQGLFGPSNPRGSDGSSQVGSGCQARDDATHQ